MNVTEYKLYMCHPVSEIATLNSGTAPITRAASVTPPFEATPGYAPLEPG